MARRRRNKRSSLDVTAANLSSRSPVKRRKTCHSRPSVGLDDLPDELMVMVLEALVNSWLFGRMREFHEEMHSFCLTSRRYYRLAKPYLYTCVDNRYHDPAKFLHEFSIQPQLGKNVKYIKWRDDKALHDLFSIANLNHKLHHTNRRELCKAITGIGLQDYEESRVSRAIKRQSPDDLLSVLLLLNPKIKSLQVEDANHQGNPHRYWAYSPLWLRVLALGAWGSLDQMQHFRNLSRLIIRMGPIKLQDVIPFLKLPALHELMLENTVHVGPLYINGRSPPRHSSIQELSILKSIVDTDAIREFVEAIKGLTEFRFEFDHALPDYEDVLLDDEYPHFSYHTLRTAISLHKDTLQILRIVEGEEYRNFEDTDQDGNQNYLGSLRDMSNVREADIGLRAFRDPSTENKHGNLRDSLPPNIEHLRIYVEDFEVEDYPVETQWWKSSLWDLAKDCRSTYPQLKTIIVSDKPIGVLPVDEHVRELKALFREQGVFLMIEGENLAVPIPPVRKWTRVTADRSIALQTEGISDAWPILSQDSFLQMD